MTRSLLIWHTGSYLPLQPAGRYGRTVWPKSALLLVVPHLRALTSEQGSVLSPLPCYFFILHSILDIFLDDHLIALRADCDTAAVATTVMPRSSLVGHSSRRKFSRLMPILFCG